MSEERDKLFEKALARHFRKGELAEAMAEPCPDAETLAAYHQRSLTASEMGRFKEHIAACARCQEILGALEHTDEIALGSEAEVSAGSLATRDSGATRPESGALVRMKPRGTWKWVAPAGAIAAVLLLWIVSAERAPVLTRRAGSGAVPAEPRTPPAAAPLPQSPPAISADSAREQKPEPLASPDLRKQRVLPGASGGARAAKAEPQANDRTAPPPAGGPGPSNRAFQQNALQQNASEPQLGRSGGAVASGDLKQQISQEKAENQKTKPAEKPLSPQPALVAGETAAIPPESRAAVDESERPNQVLDKEKKDAAGGAKLGREAAAQRLDDSVNVSMAAVTEALPKNIVSPGGKSIWNIGRNGSVRHSSDAGKTWHPQNTGVNAVLLAGSAPSDQVCWLAGTFGTVLLTTDGGVHWMRLAAPVSVPIAEITASDAISAVITLESSRLRFATYNGGQSWTMLKEPAPEK
jgi:hypothetical protein